MEDATLHVNAESFMQVSFHGNPVVEDGVPADAGYFRFRFRVVPVDRAVPIPQAGFLVVGAAAWIVIPVRPGPRIVGAVWAVEEKRIALTGIYRFFGIDAGVGASGVFPVVVVAAAASGISGSFSFPRRFSHQNSPNSALTPK